MKKQIDRENDIKPDKRWILLMITFVLAILLVPYEKAYIDDGGTIVYEAIAYKVVKWNRDIIVVNTKDDNGKKEEVSRREVYDETKIYFFGDRFKSLNELYKMEKNK